MREVLIRVLLQIFVGARVLSIGVNNSPGEWNNVVGEFL